MPEEWQLDNRTLVLDAPLCAGRWGAIHRGSVSVSEGCVCLKIRCVRMCVGVGVEVEVSVILF